METKKQTYYSKMKDIKKRYDNNEEITEDEYKRMKKYYDSVKLNNIKRSEYKKEYSKNYY